MSEPNGRARHERYAVWLLAFMALFLFADQNLMAPNLTQMAREFGFDEVERDVKLGGHISLAFWMLGGLLTLLVGYWTDRTNRTRLLTAIILIGEIPCFLTGFVQDYAQLFWLRALTGVGIGGAIPLIYSLLGDYFSAQNRAKAAGYLGLAMGLGIAIGQLLAGFLGPTFGWRLPFMIVAVPNFFFATLFLLTIREPARGQTEVGLQSILAEGHTYTTTLDWAGYKKLFSVRTNQFIFLQGVIATVPWSVFFVFLNDFYAQDKGFSVEQATLIVLSAGGTAILGGFLGGLWGNRIYNAKVRNLPLFCGLTTVIGVIPVALLINYPSQVGVAAPSMGIPLLYGALSGFFLSLAIPNVRAMLLNVNPPESRGSIFALYNLADDLGRGFGPVIISGLVVGLGRVWAFNVANLLWLGCGLVLIALAWSFPTDEAHLNQTIEGLADAIS